MSIPKVSIRQIKAARALLNWSQDDLAARSGVSTPTVKRLESSEGELGGRAETYEALLSALREGGIEFIPENGGGIGSTPQAATAIKIRFSCCLTAWPAA